MLLGDRKRELTHRLSLNYKLTYNTMLEDPTQIDYLVELVQKIAVDVTQVKEQLKEDVSQVKRDVSQLKGDVSQLKGGFAKQDRSLRDLRETLYRREITTLFGASFAKSFKFRCLDNL